MTHSGSAMKKRFHIPPSYTFVSEYGNAATVLSLAPFVSSCSSPLHHVGGLRPFYQQQKFLLNTSTRCSSPSPDTVTIHSSDGALFETPPSTNSSLDGTTSRKNPFENQAKPSSHVAKASTADKSKVSKSDTAIKAKHRLTDDIERVVQEHLRYGQQQVADGWDLIHQEGEMKVYRREVEENGIVVDPLKIFHTIQGVTGHEICRYFWDAQFRMEWETTLDWTKNIEVLDPDTVICFQMHKRVWPAAQRDSCFWSHIRSIAHSDEDQPTWVVVNHTTPHPAAPIKSPHVRLVANVALICETMIREPPLNPKDIKRENIQCRLTYVAFVNPGGWVPSAALRSVAKREYPRFLKRFTGYVIEQTRGKPILF